jgi:hypothetical protein
MDYSINTDVRALGRFDMAYQQDGVGDDGLPLYKEVLTIFIERPPTLKLDRPAEENDLIEFADEYAAFQKRHAAKKQADGYPLALWPAASRADVANCATRDIYTVQQLAALKGDKYPPAIKELAERARHMVKLQGQTGKFEAIISGLEAERDQLAEQLKEAHATLSAQNSMINTLKMRVP